MHGLMWPKPLGIPFDHSPSKSNLASINRVDVAARAHMSIPALDDFLTGFQCVCLTIG